VEEFVEQLQDIADQLSEALEDLEGSDLLTESNMADFEALEAALEALSTAIAGLGPPGDREEGEEEAEADPAAGDEGEGAAGDEGEGA
jgi:hypothetical protein